jgi:hypothetical protein
MPCCRKYEWSSHECKVKNAQNIVTLQYCKYFATYDTCRKNYPMLKLGDYTSRRSRKTCLLLTYRLLIEIAGNTVKTYGTEYIAAATNVEFIVDFCFVLQLRQQRLHQTRVRLVIIMVLL